jgi:hypothetical protein
MKNISKKVNFRLALQAVLAAAIVQGGLFAALNANAHHSFAAEFDANQPTQLSGIVTKVEWSNPHVWIYMNVKNAETNKTENWGIELGPPHLLQRRGWRRDTLSIGTLINVDGFLARNGSSRVNARVVALASTGGAPGVELDAGSSQLERNNEEANNSN